MTLAKAPFAQFAEDDFGLPLAQKREDLTSAILRRQNLLLEAPAGSGKSTLVPPLVQHLVSTSNLGVTPGQKTLLVQPRQLAARAMAGRIASLLKEQPGESVGFSVRGESALGPQTQLEIVTGGVLVRKLQADPELSEYHTVILDEIHERHLDYDLALAFLLDTQELRDDLVIIAMSATLPPSGLASLLKISSSQNQLTLPAPSHPLTVHWAPPATSASALASLGQAGARLGVSNEFLEHAANTALTALEQGQNDVLVFLPGLSEIKRTHQLLTPKLPAEVEILEIHSSLAKEHQDRIFRPDPKRRIILSSSIAQSALTIPRVSSVVDSGLERRSHTDFERQVSTLVTRSTSQANGIQRAGRANRLGPGQVWRLFSEQSWARMPAQSEPEILHSELTSLVLACADWGAKITDLAWLNQPPTPAVQAAQRVLHGLGALNRDGNITPLGKALSQLGLDPRLGRALLIGRAIFPPSTVAEIVAMLEVTDQSLPTDLFDRWRALQTGRPYSTKAWRQNAKRLMQLMDVNKVTSLLGEHDFAELKTFWQEDQAKLPETMVAIITALAFPALLGRNRQLEPKKAGNGNGASLSSSGANSLALTRYQLVGGMGAQCATSAPFANSPWLAIGSLTLPAGSSTGEIRTAIALPENLDPLYLAPNWVETNETISLAEDGSGFQLWQENKFGAIALHRQRVPKADPKRLQEAFQNWLSPATASLVPWSQTAEANFERYQWLRAQSGETVSREELVVEAKDILATKIEANGALPKFDQNTFFTVIGWENQSGLAQTAPEEVSISGRNYRVDYSQEPPRIRGKLQWFFGQTQQIFLANGSVPLSIELLSPAQRPLALTNDLGSFWQGAYQQVRAQMRGRYPKHAWPEHPENETPAK
ncbi:hypothetical protein BK816_02830 [Boudabousia tangfeifanii]|uniref:RNA helicase n=1 Tax=Boudabousia tangfeifanii TaxID=1912795 RepID=A0A1D9MJA3_9ACTO|nr:ATP-dependent helicase C-terminal domain-containing protein [Boudabousia tangfeifanii]AOZ72366.1 hypothetical protein BK816_02830 [Boudabousia tangfeifanii]